MDKHLRPKRFGVEPTSISADKQWLHWKRTFSNFLRKIDVRSRTEENKFLLLTNYVAPNVYQYISESVTFKDAMDTLESLYIKPRNKIHAGHCLATRRQHAGESVDKDLQVLKQISKDCNFKSVTTEQPIMNQHKDYEESLIFDEESSDDDAEGQIAYGTQSPAPQMEEVPLKVRLSMGTEKRRASHQYSFKELPLKKRNPVTRQTETLDKLNKILVGQTRTMEFLAQLNNKVDTLLKLNQECQTRIGVVETRIQSLQEPKKEAAITSYPYTSTSDLIFQAPIRPTPSSNTSSNQCRF